MSQGGTQINFQVSKCIRVLSWLPGQAMCTQTCEPHHAQAPSCPFQATESLPPLALREH